MPANNILAANRINADVAGLTKSAEDEVKTNVSATIREIGYGYDNIGSMLAGGLHPENFVQNVLEDVNLPKASDSLAGHLGGLIPRRNGNLMPGPAGNSVAAKRNEVG